MNPKQAPRFPLFITGHPRSGTTMLRLIFNSHSQIAIPDETGLLHWFYKRPWYKKYTRSKIPIPSPKSRAFGEDVIHNFNQQPRSLRNDPQKAISFLYEALASKEGKPYWGDKTPLHTQFTDEIIALFPNAFIINLIRDPRAVISSAKRNVKKKREGTDFWITDDLNKTIERWRWEFGLISKFCDKYPQNTLKLIYEDFVANPEKHLREICSNLNVPFEPGMLHYHEKRKKETANMSDWHKETTKPVNANNIDKWRDELTKEEIAIIEKELSVEMTEAGVPNEPHMNNLLKKLAFVPLRLTAGLHPMPDFILIGAQKGGSSALYKFISAHPDIKRAFTKEPRYFSGKFHSKSLNWYRAHFPFKKANELVGEASPSYCTHPLAPERIREVVPHVKLLLIVRNPVDRAISNYFHSVAIGAEKLGIEEAFARPMEKFEEEYERIKNEDGYHSHHYQRFAYLHKGFYAFHLKRWYEFFPKEQILVVENSELKQNPQDTYSVVCEFLGVKKWELQDFGRHNVGKAKKEAPAQLKNQLQEVFKAPNEEFFELINKRFSW